MSDRNPTLHGDEIHKFRLFFFVDDFSLDFRYTSASLSFNDKYVFYLFMYPIFMIFWAFNFQPSDSMHIFVLY